MAGHSAILCEKTWQDKFQRSRFVRSIRPLAYHVVHRKESGMQQVRVGLMAMLACGVGISPGPVAAAQVRLLYGPGSPQVEFACGEIRAALKTRGEYGCGLSPSAVDGHLPAARSC